MSNDGNDNGNVYRYGLGLCIFHPKMLASDITEAIGSEPDWFWDVGANRVTPGGTKLSGTHTRSYWAFSDDIDNERAFFAKGMLTYLDLLEERRDRVLRITETGGEISMVIDLPGSINIGDVIDWQGLKRLVDLRIGLGIEVFPGMRLPEKEELSED